MRNCRAVAQQARPSADMQSRCRPSASNSPQKRACGAIQLAAEEQPLKLLRLKRAVALVCRQEIILHGVGGPHHAALLQTTQRAQHCQLQPLWQARRKALQLRSGGLPACCVCT